MSASLAEELADTAFQLAAELDFVDTPRPAKRMRVTGTVRPRRLCSACCVIPLKCCLRVADSPESTCAALLTDQRRQLQRERVTERQIWGGRLLRGRFHRTGRGECGGVDRDHDPEVAA
jgi:hypothetical protein